MVRLTVPVLVVIALARAAIAEGFTVALDYDVRYGPLRILAMRLESEVAGDRYRVSSFFETQGLIGRLFPWRTHSESSGERDGAALHPRHHRSDGTYRRERRTVEIEYRPDGDVRAVLTPPSEEDARDAVPDHLQRATIDPLTATLLAVGAACRSRLPVFDGRRRYDLRLEELPPGAVPGSRTALYAGSARRCRAVIEPRAGFWRNDPRDDEKPTHLDLWIASPSAGFPTVPVYLELTGARGTLAMVLTKATSAAPGTTAMEAPHP